jgi:hypothetical protein
MGSFDFMHSYGWRLISLTVAASLGFAFVFNGIRKTPEAQFQNRQVGGWILISLSIALAAILLIWDFAAYGWRAGTASLCLAPVGAAIFVFLASR